MSKSLADRLTEAFEENVIELFDEADVEYEDRHIEEITEIFEKHWTTVCERKPEDEWRLEQLLDELQASRNHGNVGIIIGMAAMELPRQHPARRYAEGRLEEKYR